MDERTIVDTLRLLGIESDLTPHKQAYAAVNLSDPAVVFKKPTARVAELVIHFLLSRIDLRRANAEFGASFPSKADARSSKDFRSAALAWLKELEAARAIPSGSASPAVLVSPSAAKLGPLLWGLSCHALRCVAERDAGVKEPAVKDGVPVRLIRAQVAARARAFSEARRIAAEEAESMRRAASVIEARRMELVACKARLEEEVAMANHGGGRESIANARQRQLELASVLRPEWRRLQELSSAAADVLRESDRPHQNSVLEVESFKLPDQLQVTLASSWGEDPTSGSLGPVFSGGSVNISALLHLFSVALKLIASAHSGGKEEALRQTEEKIRHWTKAVAAHRKLLESLESGSLAAEVDGIWPSARLNKLEETATDDFRIEDPELRDLLSILPPCPNVAPIIAQIAVSLPAPETGRTKVEVTPSRGDVLMASPTRTPLTIRRPDVVEKLLRSVQRISLKTSTPKGKIMEKLLSSSMKVQVTDRAVRRKLDFSETAMASTFAQAAAGAPAQTVVVRRQPTTAVRPKHQPKPPQSSLSTADRKRRQGIKAALSSTVTRSTRTVSQQSSTEVIPMEVDDPFSIRRQIPRTPMK